jgi:transposase
MKYVKPLLPTEIITLKEMYKNAPIHRMRQRAHIILMSNNMMKIKSIALSVGLDRDTISSTIDAWESIGIRGLYDNQRTGRPPIYSEDENKIINSLVEKEPKQLKSCLSEIESQTGKTSSVDTIKRIIKQNGQRWKRIKKKLRASQTNKNMSLRKKK